METKFNISQATPIQSALVPALDSKHPVILRDFTGSGKTLGAIIGLVNSGYTEEKRIMPKQLTRVFLVPNRELALQIHNWATLLLEDLIPSTHIHHQVQVLYKDKLTEEKQIRRFLDTPPRLLISTPKMAWEMYNANSSIWKTLGWLVLDEADLLLNLPPRYSTQSKIKNRLRHPSPTHLLLSKIFEGAEKQDPAKATKHLPAITAMSATLNRPVRHYFRENHMMFSPLFIDGVSTSQSPPNIRHICLLVTEKGIRNIDMSKEQSAKNNLISEQEFEPTTTDELDDKLIQQIVNIIQSKPTSQSTMLIVKDTLSCPKTIQQLQSAGIEAQSIDHKLEKPGVLVGTETLIRGIDLPSVDFVIFVGLPKTPSHYLHTSGRTGRYGRPGIALTIIREKGRIEDRMRTMYNNINANVISLNQIKSPEQSS